VNVKWYWRFVDEEKHSRNIAKTGMVSISEGQTMRDEVPDPAMSR
jgi:hypothetical protein